MYRSNPNRRKQVKQKEKELSQDELDEIKYLTWDGSQT